MTAIRSLENTHRSMHQQRSRFITQFSPGALTLLQAIQRVLQTNNRGSDGIGMACSRDEDFHKHNQLQVKEFCVA